MRRSQADELNRPLWLRALLFLWVPAIVGAYYVVHKPWPIPGEVELLWPLADVLLALLVVTSSGGIGKRFVGRLLHDLSPFERAAIELGFGLGMVSLLILGAGVLGLVSPGAAWILLAAGALAAGPAGIEWGKQVLGQGPEWTRRTVVEVAAILLVLLLLGVSLLQALAPPTAWDSLVYHLELPRRYLASGRISFEPDNLFVGFPQLAEMLFLWGLALRAAPTAAVIGWLAGVMGVAGTAGFARRLLGGGAGWLSAAFLLAGSSLWQGLSWAYVDHWVLLYGAILAICLDLYARSTQRSYLLLAGAAGGLALSTKYTGGLLLAGAWAVVAWFRLFQWKPHREGEGFAGSPAARSRGTSMVVDGLLLAGAATAVAWPWFLRNQLQMGNPLYPFLFQGREVGALRQMFQGQGLPDRSLLDALLLPWQATIIGIEGGPKFNTSIGPFLLALAPGVLLGLSGRRREARSSLRRLVVWGAMAWVLWSLGSLFVSPLLRSRHYYGFLPAVAVLAVAGYAELEGLELRSVQAGWILSRFLVFSLGLAGLAGIYHLGRISPLRVLTREQSQQAYLEDRLGWYARAMVKLDELPEGATVKLLWEPRGFYCPVECIPDVILDQWWYSRRTIGSPAEIADAWSDKGVTHVLVYDFGAGLEMEAQPLLTDEDWSALDRLERERLQRIERFGDRIYTLYELK